MAAGLATAYADRDWRACASVFEQHWIHLIFHGHIDLLVQALFELPGPVLRASPCSRHLAEMLSAVPVSADPIVVPTDPEEVAALATGAMARATVTRLTAAFVARRIRSHHQAGRAVALATAAILDRSAPFGPDTAQGAPQGSSLTDMRTFVYLHAGLCAHQADDPEMAVRLFQQAWRHKADDTTGFAGRGAALRLAIEAAVAGESAAAQRWLERAEAEPHLSVYAEGFARQGIDLARLVIALDRAGPDELADAWVTVAESTEPDQSWPIRTWALVRHALMRSAPEDALALLDSVEAHLEGADDGLHRRLLPVLRAEAHLSLGRGTKAHATLTGVLPARYLGRVTEARIALLAGDDDGAHSFAAETLAQPGVRRRTQVEALLVKAVAELRTDSPQSSVSAVRAASLLAGDAPRSAVLSVPRSALVELVSAVPGTDSMLSLRDELPVPDLYPDSVRIVRLTKREVTVLEHLSSGVPRAEMARVLYVSENTIKHQLQSLYAKLGARTRAEAIVCARELGLLSPTV